MSAEIVEVKEAILATGEVLQVMTTEQFRGLSQPDMAAALVRVKRIGDFCTKLFREWEPILRTRMDAAREDSTTINQVKVDESATVHLGAGKEDQALTGAEVEEFFNQMLAIDPEAAKVCFEEIHKVKKAEVTKLRKQRGEPGSMERKRSDLIERTYKPAPKKLEIK